MPQVRNSRTEGQFLRGLRSIFGVPWEEESVSAYLHQLERDDRVLMPTGASNIRLVYEPMSVYAQVLHLKARCPLLQYATETPDQVLLVMDDNLPSKEGLFLVQWLPDIDMVTRWLNRLTTKTIYVNSIGQEAVVAAPLRAFALC